MAKIVCIVILVLYVAGAAIIMMCLSQNRKKPINKVHFYVARDKDGTIGLYIGKPFRGDTEFYESSYKSVFRLTYYDYSFEYFGLNKKDYTNLKWEDEPLEVFISMEE